MALREQALHAPARHQVKRRQEDSEERRGVDSHPAVAEHEGTVRAVVVCHHSGEKGGEDGEEESEADSRSTVEKFRDREQGVSQEARRDRGTQ